MTVCPTNAEGWRGYGGWAEYLAFDASLADLELEQGVLTEVWASLGGFGSRGNPVAGSASWSGAMVGIDHADIAERRFLQGDARLTADFSAADVDVTLTGIANVETGRAYDDLTWEDIPMAGGVFERGTIPGSFGAVCD